MRKILILSMLLLLSACATNEILYTDAYGHIVYKAQCDQAANLDMGDCLKLMGRQCPYGFNILRVNENATGFSTGTQTYGNAYTNSYAHANAYGYGNSAFANGYGNSQTNMNFNSWGGGFLTYSRYIIYTCR